MKLTAFHATDGDCLLLASSDGKKHVLIDGGREASFTEHARGVLSKLKKLDVVCVSHIDDDHITGVLRLIEDVVEWRAFAFRKTIDPNAKQPPFEQPPEIGEVWHNGLFALVGDKLAPEVQHVLSTATVLASSTETKLRRLASQLSDLATGEKASMELSRRLSPQQLGIPLNAKTGGKLLKRAASGAKEPGEVMKVGNLTFYLLGPSQDDIDNLKVKWEDWIKDNAKALRKLQADMLADEQRLGTLSPGFVVNPIDQGLGDGLETITEANLASLMFLVEDDAGKSVLLTGDGVSSEIIEGLKRHKKLDANGRLHVNILKVQHHGAEGNVTAEFVNTVTADHYVFCGNGAHDNPEKSVVEGFAKARLTGIENKPPVGPNTNFKFWFTSNSKTPDTTKKQERMHHMQMIEKLVDDLKKTSNRLDSKFIKDGALEIQL